MEAQSLPGEGIEVTVSAGKLGWIGTLAGVPVMLALLWLYPAARGVTEGTFSLGWRFLFGALAFFAAYAVLIAAHELLHGLGYRLLGKARARYAFDWKHMVALAAAQSPMPVTAYRWSVILPTLVLVPPPLLVGLCAGVFPVYAMGVLLLVSGVGDFWILWALRRYGRSATVVDHPEKSGCVVYIGDTKQIFPGMGGRQK